MKNSFPRKTMTLENMELLHDFVTKCVRKKITRITDHGPIFILRMQMKSGKMAIRINRKYFLFPCSFLLLSLIWAKFPRAIKCSLHNSACSCIKEQRIVLLNASLGTRELLSSSFQLACTRLSVNIDKRRSRRVIKGWGQTWRLQLSRKHLSFCLFFVFLPTEPTPYFARSLFRLSRLRESPEKVTFQRPSDHSHTRPGILIGKTWVYVFPRLSSSREGWQGGGKGRQGGLYSKCLGGTAP